MPPSCCSAPPRPLRSRLLASSAFAQTLRQALRGEVRWDAGTRAMYATDASNYRQVPIAVALPRDAADVEAAVAICRRFDVPVLSRGGGTSLAGQTCNEALVLDFTKHLNRVIEVDSELRLARVQPGCVTDDLRNRAQEHGLTWGPDPATHNRNTFGGMLGNNSCGVHAQMSGKAEANVEALEILTYDGQRMRVGSYTESELDAIVASGDPQGKRYALLRDLRDRYAEQIRRRFPKLERRISGFSLDRLLPENRFDVAKALVGTEGTCVTILEATVRLVPSPPCRVLVLAGFADIVTAARAVPLCNTHAPIALEAFDETMFSYMRMKGAATTGAELLPDGRAWLMVEFGADQIDDARARAQDLIDDLGRTGEAPDAKLIVDLDDQRELWDIRESALGSAAKVPGLADFYPGWEDSAVPPECLAEYLQGFQELLRRFNYHGAIYGHFGQGCVHCSIDFDLFTAPGIANYRRFATEAAHLCVALGGSLSGEHGDGQSRGELLPIMFGDELVEAFWEFKMIWDPLDRMNPGKVVRPKRLDQDLRWGPSYAPPRVQTHFTYPDDNGSFAFAANRCVGTGKCRRHDGGTMCPSYMATKDEAYSTRGRARLLFEMLQGAPIAAGWRDETVRDALDFCLACKGCKTECPVNVDMATYKAEFLAHYFKGRLRPPQAYLFGLMPYWLRLAAKAPHIANRLLDAPWLVDALKRVARIAVQRRLPRPAVTSFYRWFRRRDRSRSNGRRVVLWVDTWNAYFHPETAQAAVEVLEDAGFTVAIPPSPRCCGRPLYDYGMLKTARRWLLMILNDLRDDIRAGTPVVGLEPSCVSVFRDELLNFFPNDPDVRRLAGNVLMFSEFLRRFAPDYHPRLARKALVHMHCHHKSVLDKKAEIDLLHAMDVECDLPDTGCCGMAGAFGFEARHYDVSIACGERVLLPAVRAAGEETLVVADGFSCREQIAAQTTRPSLHVAELVKLAIS
jgi:FAD/FMN-containing dehydrogenase/Fe-S oxidoreductase